MATKKEKRVAGLAKHDAFLEQVRLDGLKAQEKDRQRREARARQREAESLALEEKRDRRIEKTRRELLREVALAGQKKAFDEMREIEDSFGLNDTSADEASIEQECI